MLSLLYGAMFNYAVVTESVSLWWNIQFAFCVFCPLVIIMQEILRKDCVTGKQLDFIF